MAYTKGPWKACELDNKVCCECGRSVAWGSGRFVNRIPDLDDYRERKANGRPYPQGAWICAKCDKNSA